MKSRRRKVSTGSQKSDGNQLLALSLFIMLLAFFIVINAVSQYENTRMKPVLESLEQAFASKISQRSDERPSLAEDAVHSDNEGSTLDRLQALFKSQIPGHEATVSERKGIMHVELSFEDLWNAAMTLGAPSANKDRKSQELQKDFFLPALVALLKNEKANQPYRMEIMLNTKGNPAQIQNESPKRMAADSKRLSQLSEKIQGTGLQEKHISMGIKEGKEGMVELLFLPHIPFNPVETVGDSYE